MVSARITAISTIALLGSLSMQFGTGVTELLNPLALLTVISGVVLAISLAGLDIREARKIILETTRRENLDDRIKTMLYINDLVRRKGLMSCEQLAKTQRDHLLKKGLRLLSDNPGPEFDLQAVLFAELDTLKARNKRFLDTLSFGATISPGVGLVGTLTGLVLNSHPDALGHAILTTLYGAILSNFFFLPLHEHFKSRLEEVERLQQLTVSALIKIREGVHSVLLEEHLSGFKTRYSEMALGTK